jgi:hypothetical protein
MKRTIRIMDIVKCNIKPVDGDEECDIQTLFIDICNLLQHTNPRVIEFINRHSLFVYPDPRAKTPYTFPLDENESYVQYDIDYFPTILKLIHKLELCYYVPNYSDDAKNILEMYNCVNEDEFDFITNVADLIYYITEYHNR